MKRYHVLTYGCQMNELDSEKMAGMLEEGGWSRASGLEQADLIILNTCCVRAKAEDKVKGKLGQLKKLKLARPELLIGIGGCMMQQDNIGQKFMRQFPFVDFIFGPHTLDRLNEIVEKSCTGRVLELEQDRFDVPPLPVKREKSFRAWVSIIKGCENFCSYCIVPYVRGQEVSRSQEEIVAEVRSHIKSGVREIILLGQNVNAYGRDRGQMSFTELLQQVEALPGLERLRFMTSHPRDFPLELIDAISNMPRVCEHLHLPVQAGSNRILEKMNRGYTWERYLKLVQHLRRKIPGAALTTDIIVGFPGETEEDFQATLDLVQKARFASAFTFIYSPREGTPATNFNEQVPNDIKRERLEKLMKIQNQFSLEYNQGLIGQELEVLVEGPSKKDSEYLMGRTRTNRPVIFAGDCSPGTLPTVQITDCNPHTLYGKLQEAEEHE